MKALHVIILAAGGGTRMKTDLPKVLHPICGRPMIAYALDLAAATGVKQPIVVLGEMTDQIKPYLPKGVKLVLQQKPLGTGDAVLAAKRVLGGVSGDVLILYADTPLLRRTTVQRMIESHNKSNATCTLLTATLADPTGYGRILREPTGAVVGIVEEAEANVQQRALREVNVGPLCAQAQALFEALAAVRPSAVKKESYLTQAISVMAQREGTKFQATRIEEATEAFGVNSQLDLAKAAASIRQRILEGHLNNGVTIIDPQATFIDHGVTIGHDTVIYPGTVIESGVAIGRRCAIGPFARLREGVVVADGVRIGNFVELVRTKVGTGVRMSHLGYLGDTTVEEAVNIGAGTITANFDGATKLPTTIGKGAFIGCDTILVAPVKVGPGAVTGAGSVIPKGHDVPPRQVVVGVPAHTLPKAPVKVEPSAARTKRKPAAKSARPGTKRRRAAATRRPRRASKKTPRKVAAKRRRPTAASRAGAKTRKRVIRSRSRRRARRRARR